MRHPISLTLRLTLLFTAASIIVLLTFGWIIGRSIEQHFVAEDLNELEVITASVQQTLTTLEHNQQPDEIKQRLEDILVGHHSALLRLSDSQERIVYHSPGPDFSSLPTITAEQRLIPKWSDGKHNYRLLIQRVTTDWDTYTIVAAVAIDFHLHFFSHFIRTLWLMVAGAIALMVLLAWMAVRQGHQPLRQIVNQIRQIRASELNSRIEPDTVPTELTELAHSFNELMQRLETSFAQLSHFSADIAHELRTPITNLMTQTQVVLSQPRDNQAYQETLYSNMEEYEHMAQMVGDMLFLAKADNGLKPPATVAITLATEITSLFDYYEAWAEEQGVQLITQGNATIQGDRPMLRRALGNLLANAIRHTPAGMGVTIKVSQEHNTTTVTIQNPGTAIAAEHLPHLFDRFYRIDPSRQRNEEGAGLGLAIAKSIVDIHGGNISVTSNDTLTEFQIRLSTNA